VFVQRLLVSAGVVLVALAAVVSPAGAKQPQCKALNQSQDLAYNSNKSADPLGDAISEAASGDTIKVIGTCAGNFVITKELTLKGRRSKQQEDVLTGDGSGIVLRNSSSAGAFDLTLVDLTITGGDIGVTNDAASLALTRTKVTGNGSGIVSGFDASTTIERSLVSDNHGDGIQGGFLGAITVHDSVVRDNAGSGVAGVRSNVTISDSLIAHNSNGGVWGRRQIQISNSRIEGNTGTEVGLPGISTEGGGIAAVELATLQLDHSVVRDNTASRGGGIFFDAFGALAIADSVVTGNGASESGGGIYVGADEGSPTVASISNSTVGNNSATNGGGVFFAASSIGTGAALANSTVTRNSAAYGGGIWNDRPLTLSSSAVTRNTASTAGGGIFGTGTVTVIGAATVCGNDPDDWPGCSP
jgi:predicted outer membrane repeat protein